MLFKIYKPKKGYFFSQVASDAWGAGRKHTANPWEDFNFIECIKGDFFFSRKFEIGSFILRSNQNFGCGCNLSLVAFL